MKVCLGVIMGNRGFFPGYLVEEGRKEIIDILKKQGIDVVIVPQKATRYGAVESLAEIKKCTQLFRANKDKIDGILISLPNFGDEAAISETIRRSELNVPVLIQAYPDELKKMDIKHRRDSFCGKFSVCGNLKQYGIPFSLTKLHTVAPSSKDFISDLEWFAGVCRTVKGLRRARIGSIGARTTPFKTVRYSEKLLEASGITVETADLSSIIAESQKLKDSDKKVQSKLKEISGYCTSTGIPQQPVLRMAKFAAVVDRWIRENEIDACALRCWPELQDTIGILPCVVMSMFSNSLKPFACEVDVVGAVAMYALQLASGTPSALFDWNNNYGDDPDKLVLFHCSNAPKAMLKNPRMHYNDILAGSLGSCENAYGTCVGRVKAGPTTFARIFTDDTTGSILSCIGEGEFTADPLDTFGGSGVIKIENMQELLEFLCKNGFEHHVAVSKSNVAGILFEAMNNYLCWDVYYHNS